MRFYFRTSRRTGVSLGCVGVLVLFPFLAAVWVVYAAALLLYGVTMLVVHGIEAAAEAIERRQQERHSARS